MLLLFLLLLLVAVFVAVTCCSNSQSLFHPIMFCCEGLLLFPLTTSLTSSVPKSTSVVNKIFLLEFFLQEIFREWFRNVFTTRGDLMMSALFMSALWIIRKFWRNYRTIEISEDEKIHFLITILLKIRHGKSFRLALHEEESSTFALYQNIARESHETSHCRWSAGSIAFINQLKSFENSTHFSEELLSFWIQNLRTESNFKKKKLALLWQSKVQSLVLFFFLLLTTGFHFFWLSDLSFAPWIFISYGLFGIGTFIQLRFTARHRWKI